MRRASLFEELAEEYATVRFSDDILNHIISYQLFLAAKKDTACHKVADAVNFH